MAEDFDRDKLDEWLQTENDYQNLADHKNLCKAREILLQVQRNREEKRQEFLKNPTDPLTLAHFVDLTGLESRCHADLAARKAFSSVVLGLESATPEKRREFFDRLK